MNLEPQVERLPGPETDTRDRRSKTIGKIAAALAKAQGEMENAEKDVKGNYGKYSTLAATWNAIRKPLSKNEIAVYQRPLSIGGKLHMCTMLLHSSGEFLDEGELELIFDRTGGRITPMQAMGSAVTYARRYTLQAATGIAPEDDDGQGAGAPPAGTAREPQPTKPRQPVPGRNEAPALNAQVNEMFELMAERQIQADELQYMCKKLYGVDSTKALKQWQIIEINALLSEPSTTSSVVMAKAESAEKTELADRIGRPENATIGDSQRVTQPTPAQTKAQASNALPESARSSNGNKPGVFQAAKLARVLGPKVGKESSFDPGQYVIGSGLPRIPAGKRIIDVPESTLRDVVKWADDDENKGKPGVAEFVQYARDFLASVGS